MRWMRVAQAKRHWIAALCFGGVMSFSCGFAGAVGNSENIGENDKALAERLVRLEVAGRLCSGVIYTSSVVLTAAHCIKPQSGDAASPGDAKIFLHSENYAHSYRPQSIIIHPSYGGTDWGHGLMDVHDIAILFMKDTVGAELKPLNFMQELPFGNKVAILGYGPETPSATPKLGKVTMTANIPRMQGTDPYWVRLIVIAKDVDAKRMTCGGDSGGPVFPAVVDLFGEPISAEQYAKDYGNPPTLLGLVSAGTGEDLCSDQSRFVRTDLLGPWVVETAALHKRWVELQLALNEAGCDAGPVDGVWGEKGYAALKRFSDATGADVRTPSDYALKTVLAASKPACT